MSCEWLQDFFVIWLEFGIRVIVFSFTTLSRRLERRESVGNGEMKTRISNSRYGGFMCPIIQAYELGQTLQIGILPISEHAPR